jgi:hypothetical protein
VEFCTSLCLSVLLCDCELNSCASAHPYLCAYVLMCIYSLISSYPSSCRSHDAGALHDHPGPESVLQWHGEYVCMYVCVYVCVYVCMYVYVCVCMCVDAGALHDHPWIESILQWHGECEGDRGIEVEAEDRRKSIEAERGRDNSAACVQH